MPTYEYRCKSCGEHLEVAQSFKDDALTECPACGGPLRKVFGSIGIAFKGSGFYKNDSRAAAKSGSSGDGGSSGSSTSDSGSKSGPKSDGASAKPEAKPAAEKSPSAAAS
jgi:putative FmdB family regulatory protein